MGPCPRLLLAPVGASPVIPPQSRSVAVDEHVRSATPRAVRAETDLYSAYAWCLNPILPLRDLFHRLREELERFSDRQARWQQEECRINLFLFVSGIACIVDDHLARRLYDLSTVAARFPRLRAAVAVAQSVLDGSQTVYGALADRWVARWRTRWGECIDRMCELLTSEAAPNDPAWSELGSAIDALTAAPFSEHLLRRRLTLPAAFRNQDLTHHDVLTLAERFAASYPEPDRPAVVIAPRSAGSYFAPLVKARLTALGWRDVTWFSVRPKKGVSRGERRSLAALKRTEARVLLVDAPANTGTRFQLILDLLKRLRVRSERIVLLAPRSPARLDWMLPGVAMITLDPRGLLQGAAARARPVPRAASGVSGRRSAPHPGRRRGGGAQRPAARASPCWIRRATQTGVRGPNRRHVARAGSDAIARERRRVGLAWVSCLLRRDAPRWIRLPNCRAARRAAARSAELARLRSSRAREAPGAVAVQADRGQARRTARLSARPVHPKHTRQNGARSSRANHAVSSMPRSEPSHRGTVSCPSRR